MSKWKQDMNKRNSVECCNNSLHPMMLYDNWKVEWPKGARIDH